MKRRDLIRFGAGLAVMSLLPASARAANVRGVTDTEILLGQTNPYSGPASAYSAYYGRVQTAYAAYVNDRGGINGRKVRLLSYDDGHNPSRTVEQVRKLVEQDGVAAMFHIFGTAPNRAVVKYLNNKKIPTPFAGVSGEGFAEPETQPYTMPLQANSRIEARIYGRYMAEHHKGKKVGLLFQQDEIGESVRRGLREGLGSENESLIVSEQPYQLTDTTVDSQILNLRASGAEVFYNSATLKHAAQAIKKSQELGWTPPMFILTTTTAVRKILAQSGGGLTEGTIGAIWHKSPLDPIWDDDPAMVEWRGFMKKYYPEGDITEPACVLSTCYVQAMFYVLEKCGDDLSGDNIMKVAASLQDVSLPLLLPGITLNTSPTDYDPIDQLQLIRIENGDWKLFGSVISG